MSLTNHAISNIIQSGADNLILKAPKPDEIKFFNEEPPPITHNELTESVVIVDESTSASSSSKTSRLKKPGGFTKPKRSVTFPENVIKDYSEPPKLGWIPGSYPTNDLLEAYMKSCERHKCKSIQNLVTQLKAFQGLDCSNGEKVNFLDLRNERIDARQIETLEEIFKRLSFKTIDLEHITFEDDSCSSTLFEILGYYDTVEKLIMANHRTAINMMGWQELSKFIRKGVSLEYLDIQGHTFNELIYFTYLARSIKLTTTLRILHLEHSNINGRFLIMLAAAMKDNEQIKELYLGDNKIQPSDGNPIATMIKENSCLEILDLRNNYLQDKGLSHICSGLSEQHETHSGLKALVVMNNNITAIGVSYLSKALIHNRSLTTINIAHNSLTNEAIYELKDALIVNKHIACLFLNKTKLSDVGVIALAEYIAETTSLNRLDLRDNDIRLGGLMALVSSLKINKTLSRLDVDKEPKKEHTFFNITFQQKDSLETSKRLYQDMNEYCLRNQKEQRDLEAERAKKAREQAEERRQLQIENERQLLDLVKEINNQVNENLMNTDEALALSPTTSGENMDELLDKIIVNTSIQNNAEGEGHFSDIDQFNYNHYGLISEGFQLVDGVELESSETDPDMVIFKAKSEDADSDSPVNSSLNVEAGSLNTTLTKEQEMFELEILSVTNSLVERTIWNLKQQEPRSVKFLHQNSSTLMFESLDDETRGELTGQGEDGDQCLSVQADRSKFSNFNDSNDLSTSIELESCHDIEDKPTIPPVTFNLSTNDDPMESSRYMNDSSIIDESESCNDSDIEVLEVSSRFVNKIMHSSQRHLMDNPASTAYNLLDSIDELAVQSLVNSTSLPIDNNPAEHEKQCSRGENECSDENYDLVNADNNFEDQNSIETSFNFDEIDVNAAKSTPIRPTIQSQPSQAEQTSSSDTSLILSKLPYNQFSLKFDSELSPPESELATAFKTTTTTTTKTSSHTSSPTSQSNENPVNLLDLTESTILPVTVDGNFVKPADKSQASDNRPFFASKMTSSQISEELSNEIAFKWES